MTLIESVRKAAPTLTAEDAEGARLGKLTDTAWSALQATGVLQALQPRRWGGSETSLTAFLDATVELGRASPAAGWVTAVVGVHPWQVALFPETTQKEIWADDPKRALASSYTPTGTIEHAPGGYRVSGRWSFSSGCLHCDGVILGGIVGTRTWEGHEVPDFTSVILDRDQYTIDHTWNTSGLQGTGSHDIVVDDAFVPERRGQSHVNYTYHLGAPLPGRELNPAPLYRLPWAVVFNSVIAAGALAAARGFLDAWIESTRERKTPSGPMRDDPVTQNHLAESLYTIDGGLLRLRHAANELMKIAESGEWPTRNLRAQYRHELACAGQHAGAAVTGLLRSSSGRSAFLDHPLNRRYQDVMAAVSHAFLGADPLGRTAAALQLGSDNYPPTYL